jgi:hypothetical protein
MRVCYDKNKSIAARRRGDKNNLEVGRSNIGDLLPRDRPLIFACSEAYANYSGSEVTR